VFVAVRPTLVFADGKLAALRQTWTFDEMYTAFAVTGFGKDAATPSASDLQSIAERNMEALAPYHLFTTLRLGATAASFGAPTAVSAALVSTADDESLQLRFTLPLRQPFAVTQDLFLQVYDPTYFAAFTFAKGGMRFEGDGGRCSTRVADPKPLSPAERAKLTESFFTNLSPGTNFGVKLAQTADIVCRPKT
jgi:ABC-type uncharacterized transport system substrate-binding protein